MLKFIEQRQSGIELLFHLSRGKLRGKKAEVRIRLPVKQVLLVRVKETRLVVLVRQRL